MLHDALDSAEILTDEGEDEALDAEDGDDEGAQQQRAGEVVLADPVDDPVQAERKRGERAEEPEDDAGRLDRLRPEAREHVQGEARQPERRVPRRPVARRVPDVDLHDRGAAGEDQRLRELLAADRAEHRLDRLAAVCVEGAPEVRDVDAGEPAEHPVDEPGGQRPAPRVTPRRATAAGDVVPRLHRLDERGDVLGGFWRSPSMVTTTPPRARERPACMAGCWPEFRLRRTARTCASSAWIRSSAANVPSVEPSST